jgi:hypothetical protein
VLDSVDPIGAARSSESPPIALDSVDPADAAGSRRERDGIDASWRSPALARSSETVAIMVAFAAA